MNRWLLILVAVAAFSALAASQKRIVCYYESWAVYRPDKGKHDVEDIDPTLCTHLIYTFVGISEAGQVVVLDPWNDLPDEYGLNAFGRFVDLKKKSPGTKTMVAIGGWNEGSEKYSKVVNNDATRQKFVKNVVAFLQKHKFDGFDVDWEYPNQRGGTWSDKEKYVTLLQELHEAFKPHGYVLSAAVGAGTETVDLSYDVPNIAKYLDMINVMTYDLHGDWDNAVGANAPLYPSAYDKEEGDTSLNVDYLIKNYIQLGAPAEKINLGMGFYGRSFTLSNPKNTKQGAPITGPGTGGPYTEEAGMLGYNEICEDVKSRGWTDNWEKDQQVPYAIKGNQWVGYDNVKSISLKSDYILKNNIGGAMIWSIDTDDYNNVCGFGKYPLLTAVNNILNGGATPPTDAPTTLDPDQPTEETTTESPTEPTDAPTTQGPHTDHPEKLCKEAGRYVRDPLNCRIFYLCTGAPGSFSATEFECGEGTAYDEERQICDFTEHVKC